MNSNPVSHKARKGAKKVKIKVYVFKPKRAKFVCSG